ncbi:parB-like partition protein [Candidatus Koribacter versatilis Ellin345]|uniref:ParB-like partition protein n=1 Tax=Koribacter versatilis (strain Ellin345) TaxID=204669 RepID=Q1ILQ6_KORVE|nr:ParB/RepB/Spo0J family partition protein [Candidatus Koribacter versatilis]ABF42194.1 parB-like partition protein [Candidatus Koribacter versatilis Ellin345]
MSVATTIQPAAPPAALLNDSNAYQLLPLAQVVLSKTNPKGRCEGPEFDELVASIRQHGILQPILVRPVGEEGKYEIVAGERRYSAAKAAGREDIPAVTRLLSDREAHELQLIENLQRKDVTALEEAEGFRNLLQSLNAERKDGRQEELVKEIASRVNKSVRHVYSRMKLTELTKDAASLLAIGKIGSSHADEIVRLTPDDQVDLLKKHLEREEWVGEKRQKVVLSVRQLRTVIENNYQLDLSTAPFKLDDDRVKPACSGCPKNTANAPLLYPDLKKAKCTDVSCFQRKVKGFVQIEVKALAKDVKVQVPIVVTAAWWCNGDQKAKTKGAWAEAQIGSCAHIQAATVVDEFARPVGAKLVCANMGCLVHFPNQKKNSSGGSTSRSKKSVAKQKDLDKKRLLDRELEVAPDIAVFRAVLDKVAEPSSVELGVITDWLLGAYGATKEGEDALLDYFAWPKGQGMAFDRLRKLHEKHATGFNFRKGVKFIIAAIIADGIGAGGGSELDDVAKKYNLDVKSIRAKALADAKQKQALSSPKAGANGAAGKVAPQGASETGTSKAAAKKSPAKTSPKKAAKKATPKKAASASKPKNLSAKKGGR